MHNIFDATHKKGPPENPEIFVSILFSWNGVIILSFTDIGKSCPSREF